jgi:hypothetical protein
MTPPGAAVQNRKLVSPTSPPARSSRVERVDSVRCTGATKALVLRAHSEKVCAVALSLVGSLTN